MAPTGAVPGLFEQRLLAVWMNWMMTVDLLNQLICRNPCVNDYYLVQKGRNNIQNMLVIAELPNNIITLIQLFNRVDWISCKGKLQTLTFLDT